MAFSSEIRGDRGFFVEILDHTPGAVRLERLNNAAPLLRDHGMDVQVGVIERGSARIDSDRKGRCRGRFAKVGPGAEEFELVRDEIRTQVSVGYIVHDFERIEASGASKDTPPVIRVTDWEPVEISIVSSGLDQSVGIGRSITQEVRQMSDENTASEAEPRETAPVPAATSNETSEDRMSEMLDRAVGKERKRNAIMSKYLRHFPSNKQLRELVETSMEDGTSLEDFQSRAVPMLRSAVDEMRVKDDPVANLGMERKEIKRFSILRAVDALAGQMTGGPHWSKAAPFEHECSNQVADALDRDARGFFVPYDVQRGSSWTLQTRAAPMDVSENDDLVATDHLATSYIEALRAQAVSIMAGARTLTGLVGNVDIPRTDTPAVFTWIGEDGDSADTEVVTGTVSMSPKTISGSAPITRRLRKQSSPDVELLVRQDLIRGGALGVDLGALAGTGASNQPLGVIGQTGVGTVTIAAAGNPTWAEVVEFETDVAAANGLMGSLYFITTAGVRGAMKVRAKDAGSGQFVAQPLSGGGPGAAEANGYPILISTQLAANTILFGNFNELLIGMWGVLDLRVDLATEAKKDRVTLRAFQDIDIAVRHGPSFSKNA